jgi:hypothetical protein
MANVDFYAVKEDIRGLMHFLYEETDLRVFESYSEPEKELREFRRFQELWEAFEADTDPYGRSPQVLLQLWSPSVTQDVQITRIELKPTRRYPFTFRYRISGVALIQLYLAKPSGDVIADSHYGHWNEAGARQRSGGNADAVDWSVLSKLSGRIQRHLRNKMAVAKVCGRPILPAAFGALQGGAELFFGPERYNALSPKIEPCGRASKS